LKNSYDFLEAVGCIIGDKTFDFGADLDHNPDPAMFEWNFYHGGI